MWHWEVLLLCIVLLENVVCDPFYAWRFEYKTNTIPTYNKPCKELAVQFNIDNSRADPKDGWMDIMRGDIPATLLDQKNIQVIRVARSTVGEGNPGIANDPTYAVWYCWFYTPDIRTYYFTNGYALNGYRPLYIFAGTSYLIPSPSVYMCKPGTWSTCNDTLACEMAVPKDEASWIASPHMPFFVNIGGQPNHFLVNDCYPCELGIFMGHYVVAGNAECTGIADPNHKNCRSEIRLSPLDLATKGAQVVCFGSTYPPMFCPEGSVANPDRSKCVCTSGTYWKDSKCTICPIAHFCFGGEATVCGDDTYNFQVGQSACSSCLTVNQECTGGFTLAKCSLENDKEELTYLTRPTCVPCLRCKHNVLSSTNYTNYNKGRLLGGYLDCYEDPM